MLGEGSILPSSSRNRLISFATSPAENVFAASPAENVFAASPPDVRKGSAFSFVAFDLSPPWRTIENSPAIHRWVSDTSTDKSVKRTIEKAALTPQHSAVRYTDSFPLRTSSPAVNCWATIDRPLRGLAESFLGKAAIGADQPPATV